MFITFEGLDGAGKSTQIERLKRRIELLRLNVVWTREPGGTEIGDKIRALLLDPNHSSISANAEVLLYAASRSQLVNEVIRPALDRGDVVLCDRFVDASLAYQGAGLSVGVDAVRAINQFATGGLVPDLTLLFDIEVELSKARVGQVRQDERPDRIELRSSEYFSRVRSEFLRIANREPSRVVVLDAAKSEVTLEQEIWSVVANHLRTRGIIGGD